MSCGESSVTFILFYFECGDGGTSDILVRCENILFLKEFLFYYYFLVGLQHKTMFNN